MILHELFSGSGSVGTPWREAGHAVLSIDIDGRFGAEIVQDILQVDYRALPTPDVIWASPPCEQYSIARSKAKRPRNLTLADALASKAWEIISHFRALAPELLWFVENPDSSMLWKRAVSAEMHPQVRLDYCQYSGPGYRKRTRVATNALWVPRPLCDPNTCPACVDRKHVMSAQRGPSGRNDRRLDNCSVDQLHALPRELCEEILRVCEAHQWQLA
jgi:hypothetical protein